MVEDADELVDAVVLAALLLFDGLRRLSSAYLDCAHYCSQPLRPLPSVAFEAKRPEIVQHAFAAFGNWRDVIHFEPSTLIRGFPT